LSALLALSATLFYVFVYTLWLKRTSTQNIVIGGAAGAVPVLVGWSAVTNSLAWPPLVLFVIVFLWAPPPFWSPAIPYAPALPLDAAPLLVAGDPLRRGLPDGPGPDAAGRRVDGRHQPEDARLHDRPLDRHAGARTRGRHRVDLRRHGLPARRLLRRLGAGPAPLPVTAPRHAAVPVLHHLHDASF